MYCRRKGNLSSKEKKLFINSHCVRIFLQCVSCTRHIKHTCVISNPVYHTYTVEMNFTVYSTQRCCLNDVAVTWLGAILCRRVDLFDTVNVTHRSRDDEVNDRKENDVKQKKHPEIKPVWVFGQRQGHRYAWVLHDRKLPASAAETPVSGQVHNKSPTRYCVP